MDITSEKEDGYLELFAGIQDPLIEIELQSHDQWDCSSKGNALDVSNILLDKSHGIEISRQ